ncbi:hypothetical protein OAQ71_00650 [bacterium]|nr:hypothetical protein [bacterium]
MKLAFPFLLAVILFVFLTPSCDTAENAGSATKDFVSDAANATGEKIGDAATVSGTWWKQNRTTRTQLENNEYGLFKSEAVLLERLSRDLQTLHFQEVSPGDDVLLQTARSLASIGNIDAAIEQYSRWQEEWLDGPTGPPLAQVKEALLAPSMAFSLHYVRARSLISPMTSEEQIAVLRSMLPEAFLAPVTGGLTSRPALAQIRTAKEVLGSARLLPEALTLPEDLNGPKASEYVAAAIAPGVMSGRFWGYVSELEERAVREDIYQLFIESIFESYEEQQNELIDNKALFLLIKDLLEYKERADAQLEAALDSPLLSPVQVADLRSFREVYREYFDQHIRLVCLYYVDMPLRMRLLWTSLSLDRAKGWNDDEGAIQEAGLSLAGVVAQLEFFVDGSTHKLFGDIWQRFKEELSDEEFAGLKTKSRFVPDWMKTLGVKDIEEKVSSK